MLTAVPDFPAAHADVPHVTAGLTVDGVALRPAGPADLPFLRHLYGETRADELAAVAWPEAARAPFLDSQFGLQHRHYVSHYADADFLVLEQGDAALGRLYLQRGVPDFLIVDISLLRCAQGKGIGSRLIAAVQELAAAAGCGVQLHVDLRNLGAQRLYRRLGFEPTGRGAAEAYLHMRWRASAAASLS
jgi:ribosomal protein S18 acetylase RimI-like enzyme